jgi:hypothetical protein
MRVLLAALLFCILAPGGTEPKAKPEEYPVHGRTGGGVAIGADYTVQSISTPRGSFIAKDYLVVEIAVFPPRSGAMIRASDFSLRVNGAKQELLTQTPGMVAASLKYEDWTGRRGIQAQAGPVILGPRPSGRFPGDNRSPVPGPRPAPQDTAPEVEREQADPSDAVDGASLNEGPARQPRSGYIYFPYGGKLAKIKKVELIYRPESGQPVTLRLR